MIGATQDDVLRERVEVLERRLAARDEALAHPLGPCSICGCFASARCRPCFANGYVVRLCDSVCADDHRDARHREPRLGVGAGAPAPTT